MSLSKDLLDSVFMELCKGSSIPKAFEDNGLMFDYAKRQLSPKQLDYMIDTCMLVNHKNEYLFEIPWKNDEKSNPEGT